MIDTYQGRLDAARTEIERADAIARVPGHTELLDQVLLSEAEVELASGNGARTSALLIDSKGWLEKNHPMSKTEAWRYARWDTVNAGLMAAKGDTAAAQRTLVAVQHILRDRFGPTGFYTQLAERQQQRIARPQ